jgi:riboflavin kinase/FMN adenylyltransferase
MIVNKGNEKFNLTIPVVTLGIFDGVHVGHRALLDRLVSAATETGGESVVITFYPHPRIVLGSNQNISFLTTMNEKQELLRKAGIDHLIIFDFNTEFSNIKACDFIRDVLVRRLGAKHLIVGYDHHFGSGGEGDFNTIRKCPDLISLKMEQLNEVIIDDNPVSSTWIRNLLLNGQLDEANKMLGYFYSLTGSVIHGKHLGRSIGFPTANIKPPDEFKLIPGNGVYAVEVQLNDMKFKGMLSIGYNPTVSQGNVFRTIEVNIIDFDSDIYGSEITIIFRKRLRDEKKFGNIAQLAAQMEIDRSDTIRFLS